MENRFLFSSPLFHLAVFGELRVGDELSININFRRASGREVV